MGEGFAPGSAARGRSPAEALCRLASAQRTGWQPAEESRSRGYSNLAISRLSPAVLFRPRLILGAVRAAQQQLPAPGSRLRAGTRELPRPGGCWNGAERGARKAAPSAGSAGSRAEDVSSPADGSPARSGLWLKVGAARTARQAGVRAQRCGGAGRDGGGVPGTD